MTAVSLGYYEEENLDVEFQWLQGSAAAVQQVGAGSADLGVAGSDTILGGLAEDLPLIAVANHLQNTPTGIVYPSEESYSTFADFAGLRISTSQVGPEAPTLISRLQEAGLDPESDVELIYVDPQAKCAVMLTGESDACTGFNTFQLLQVRQEDPEAKFLSFSTEDRPLLGHSIFANTSYAEQNGDVIRRFLRATARGFAEADKDLEKATDYVLENNPEGADREFFRAGIDIMHGELIRSERTEANGWGRMEDEPWQNLQSLLLSGEVIAAETPLNEVYTNEYLPEDVDF
jgi:NitT/TauT family transport system substrate-binding protein